MRIGIDIDGTLRDFDSQIEEYLEMDHPDKFEVYTKIKGTKFRVLEDVFGGQEDLYKWMYEERVFEIFGTAKKMHRNVMNDLNTFAKDAKNQGHHVFISSVQRGMSITASLWWLAKNGCRIQEVVFHDTMEDKANSSFDVIVDDCPEILKSCLETHYTTTHDGKQLFRKTGLKVPHKYNEDIACHTVDIANGGLEDLYKILDIKRMIEK